MNREELLKKIDEQLVFELQSGYEYKQMASEFNDMDWDGFEHFMETQAHEEYEHAEYFRHWLQEVGYKIEYKTIEAPKADYDKDVLSIFKAALEHEKEVTRRIRELFDAAHEIKFYEVYTLLQKFIDEQIEEEATFDNIIAKLERTENSNAGLAILDHEMAQRQ